MDYTDLIKRLRKYGPRSGPMHYDIRLDAADAIEALVAERDRLRKDVERYRWLRCPENRVTGVPLEWDNERHCYKWDADKVDAAIDAAMSQEKEKRDV